ncbi:MAG: hypothetical protein M1823_000005 [Watsoniomyces obsoletus]|nr:MAG: hypothetical protein M1823_000005 [Watsoniomyces obsoletus]
MLGFQLSMPVYLSQINSEDARRHDETANHGIGAATRWLGSHPAQRIYRRAPPKTGQPDRRGQHSRKEPAPSPLEDQQTWSEYREDALAYKREFFGSSKKAALRKKLQKYQGEGEDVPKEVTRFRLLSEAYSLYNNADVRLRKLEKGIPKAPPKTDLTPEQAEQLQPAYNTYMKQLYRRYTKAELEHIAKGQGDPEAVALYRQVIEPAKAFRNYQQRMRNRREKAPLDSEFYTAEQRKIMERLEQVKTTNREGYLEYGRLYTKSKAKDALRKRMMARDGTVDQLKDWDRLYPQFRAYTNAQRKISTMGRLIVVELDKRLGEDVLRMEELRREALEYMNRFSGKHRKDWRVQLENHDKTCDAKDVADYHRLRPKFLEYRKLYHQAYRRSKRLARAEKLLSEENTDATEAEDGSEMDDFDEDAGDGTVDEEASDAKIMEEIKGVGVRRYYVTKRPGAGNFGKKTKTKKDGGTTSTNNAFQLGPEGSPLAKVRGLVNSGLEGFRTFSPDEAARVVEQLPRMARNGLQQGLQRAFPNGIQPPPKTVLGGYGGGFPGLPGRAAPFAIPR